MHLSHGRYFKQTLHKAFLKCPKSSFKSFLLPVSEALLYCNCAFCSDTAFVRLPHCYSLKFRRVCSRIYLSHDSNWRGPHSLSNLVFYQVEHVLVIKQADQVKRTKAGCTPQGQIPDYHGAVEVNKKDFELPRGNASFTDFTFLASQQLALQSLLSWLMKWLKHITSS